MASQKPQQRFFQQIKINGKEAPIFNLTRGVYIESIGLDGPQLVLHLNDRDSNLRDTMRLVSGAELELTMGDVSGRGDAYFKSSFVVVSIHPNGQNLRVEALDAGVFALKQPVPAPRFFIGVRVKDMLTDLFPGYTIQTPLTARVTHHITMGATPASVLRKLESDLGAALWVSRGVVYCIPRNMLGGQEKGFPTLEYQAQQTQHPIQAYKPLYEAPTAAREVRRNYASWDTVGGLLVSQVNPGSPRKFVPGASLDELDKMGATTVPAMICDMPGNGIYTAGMTVGVRLHRMNREAVLDESMPPKQVIMTVSHIDESNEYKCKLTTGVSQI
ncbi:hypothetical protein [Aeromonas hydrophila]|nr:hypothetical protein [Aeromonas hydrophila]